MHSFLSALSGVVFLAGFGPYIWSIVKPKSTAQPAIVSWIIWAILDIITFVAMYQQGVLNGTITGAVIGVVIVLVLALFTGKFEYGPFDPVCFIGSIMGLGLWWYFDSPTIGIVISQVLILVGAVPTWIAAVRNPEGEDRVAWAMYFLGALLGVLAIPEYTLDNAAQPWTFLILEMIMVYILYFRARPQGGEPTTT